MKTTILFIVIILSFTCHNRLFAQNKEDSVISLPLKMAVPENAIKKGSIKVGNNATETHCDYEEVIAEAKEKAKKMGGNIVKITALIPPAFISKCYKIEADVYYCPDLPQSILQERKNSMSQPENSKNYVELYVYRLIDTIMLSPTYYLHLNKDTVLCLVKNKSRDSIRVYSEGPITLWAKTMHKESLKLDTKFGEAYYIRCGLSGTELNTTPVIEQVDKKTGAEQFATGGRKNKEQGPKYLEEVH